MSKDWVLLFSFTLITSLAWIAFDIYHATTETTLPPVVQEQMRPLNPKLETEAIENLKGK